MIIRKSRLWSLRYLDTLYSSIANNEFIKINLCLTGPSSDSYDLRWLCLHSFRGRSARIQKSKDRLDCKLKLLTMQCVLIFVGLRRKQTHYQEYQACASQVREWRYSNGPGFIYYFRTAWKHPRFCGQNQNSFLCWKIFFPAWMFESLGEPRETIS